jgi:alpha-tubulin suppressor-like RCC1 family protein
VLRTMWLLLIVGWEMQRQVCCGQSHTMLLTGKGTCYAWGHVADGRLGVGTAKRLGVRIISNESH